MTATEMARIIEHTLLKPEATASQIDALCDEAIEFNLGAVCVNPLFVQRVASRLASSRSGNTQHPRIISVAGFPLGASTSRTKADEARRAMDDGADEIDMVAAIGPLVDANQELVCRDIEAVAQAVHGACAHGVLKVILEAAALTPEQLVLGCRLSVQAGADFVKTSTGYHAAGGATVEHVRLMCQHASPLPVKASGGIRTADAACAMVNAGAARIGTSSGVAIVRSLPSSTS